MMTDTVLNNFADEVYVKDCFRMFGFSDRMVEAIDDIAGYANENDIPLMEAARMAFTGEITFKDGKGVRV